MSLVKEAEEKYPKSFADKKFLLKQKLEDMKIKISDLQLLKKNGYSYPVIKKILSDKGIEVDSTYTIKDLINSQNWLNK